MITTSTDVPSVLPTIRPRQATTQPSDNWWTTSGGSTVLPSAHSSSVSSTYPPADTTTDAAGVGKALTTYATSSSVTVTQSSTTSTSFSQIVVTIPTTLSPTSASAAFSSSTPVGQIDSQARAVCIGNGLDASADGLIAAVVLPSAIGLLLWILFAIIRPHYRQLYGLREWFVRPELRPKALGSGFFAFLFPHVPFVPSIPTDVSNAGSSPAEDAELFPSDEQMSQRALWICLIIALGWTVLGLAGALPLYLITTPCLADLPSPSAFTGAYSTLQDLSLLRLLRAWDTRNTDINTVTPRAVFAEMNSAPNIRTRFIVLTALVTVLAVLPALYKILKEFNRLVAYRRRWIDVQCGGKEMGWLSARKAPGFVGWGEKRLKEFILKAGLSSSLETSLSRTDSQNGHAGQRRRRNQNPLTDREEANLEVDVQSLFSIGDTHHLALLIDERDEILENLEIAETRYISSFRLTTPDPSIADYMPPLPENPARPYISRPRALGTNRRRRNRRALNPAYAASSLAPTSFVAPSQYYKLRGVQGVSGGKFAEMDTQEQPTFSESINSRVVGTRFQEVNRSFVGYGRLPIGSPMRLEKSGELGPSSSAIIPDPSRYGPNHAVDSSLEYDMDDYGMRYLSSPVPEEQNGGHPDDEWVDLYREHTDEIGSEQNGIPASVGPSFRRRVKKESLISVGRRETFPLRNRNYGVSADDVPPPHLRLQLQQPFVRPLSGVNHDDLGAVYGDISQWRSKLKVINAEIAEAQRESYNDIAEGVRIKGWLMVGRGLRFIPGMHLIEGRAKEDIRWDVLQNERTVLDTVLLWTVIAVVTVLLAAGLTAVSGLALGTAPDVAHFLPFLGPLVNQTNLASGLATTLVPAVAATLFITIALALVNWAANIHGSISITGGKLAVFKFTFFMLTVVATIWLVAVGALLFAMRAFSTGHLMPQSIADGAIYMSVLMLTVVVTVVIIFPALLLLQPGRLWHVIRAQRQAVTPRQRFRAMYPRTFNPSFATGACVLAIVFASTFSLIFPLIGPPVVILLFLTLVAQRFLVGYVYARTHSQTGGLLQIWLLRRFGTLLAFQPLLLGLIFLSRRFWIEGGILIGTAVAMIVFVEGYTSWKTRLPGRRSLSPIAQDSLQTFQRTAKPARRRDGDEESTSLVSSARAGTRTRGSMASVLEMMSLTLAVLPAPSHYRGPVPLKTETLDDLTATERAARTHPDAPPHLPPLPFTDHAEDMAGILYAPELIAPPPIIWLPNDSAGVARSEAYDLQKYHDLQVTLDVRAKEDVLPRSSSRSSRIRT